MQHKPTGAVLECVFETEAPLLMGFEEDLTVQVTHRPAQPCSQLGNSEARRGAMVTTAREQRDAFVGRAGRAASSL